MRLIQKAGSSSKWIPNDFSMILGLLIPLPTSKEENLAKTQQQKATISHETWKSVHNNKAKFLVIKHLQTSSPSYPPQIFSELHKEMSKRGLDISTDSPSSGASPSQKSAYAKVKKVKFAANTTSPPHPRASTSVAFDSIDDAPDLQFDELNQVGKIRKGRVKVDGYDSDSSTENTDVRHQKKKKSEQDGDDEDMFGSDADPKSQNPKAESKDRFEKIDVGMHLKKGAEGKEYLDLGDIEGQEFGKDDDEEDQDSEKFLAFKSSKTDENDAEMDSANGYSDEEEDYVPGDEFANDDDAPRARRKSKKGMGFMLSKFNMAEELQEGRMTADGSYVASAKDPEAVHDNWLEGVDSKKVMKQAREAKKKRDEEMRKRAEIDNSLMSHRTRKDCYIALLGLLPANDGRSVSQILCQLGNDKRARQQAERKKVVKKTIVDHIAPDSVVPASNQAAETLASSVQQQPEDHIQIDKTIAEITDLASTLMATHGDLDIYDMTHGSITGILKSEGLVPRDWMPPSSNTIYQSTKSSNDSEVNSNPSRKSLISRPTAVSQSSSSTPSTSIYYRFKPNPSHQNSVNTNGAVYGPFDRAMMEGWASQGFFGTNFESVEVKIDDSISGLAPWGTWNQIIH
ncbi:hypothetical protein O181_013285 [Austropuccinia psidii MF-1]|uniref:GYF domain-containing protein n=1 Tax=Austropuccinia psidii MF-1 TaxID=1389203 RepID=A0A9Q3BYQ3_9BASI|nr:hypothetical protein [Austropuccinia psidii MF-1]